MKQLSDAKSWLHAHSMYDAETGCHIWLGVKNNSGYGSTRTKQGRKTTGAHRRAWNEFYGDIPEGMDVCHKCDVRLCINPDHLFLGTRKDNLQDASKKGRMWCGENRSKRIRAHNNPNKSLGWSQVNEIRQMYRQGTFSQSQLGKMFAVSKSNIGRILNNETWCI